MSAGFLLPSEDAALIWRGPKKNGLIKQLLRDVDWDELDYLLVDLVLSHLLRGDRVLVRRLTIVILKSLVTVHTRHLLLIRVHHVRVVVALKHALLKTLLSQLGSRHSVVSNAWHLWLISTEA